jgi:hypothetical protein
MGEIEFIGAAAGSENTQATQKLLADAVRRFSRSIELCDDYLRGYYGLVKVCYVIRSPRTNLITHSRQLTGYSTFSNRQHRRQHQISLQLISSSNSKTLQMIS